MAYKYIYTIHKAGGDLIIFGEQKQIRSFRKPLQVSSASDGVVF